MRYGILVFGGFLAFRNLPPSLSLSKRVFFLSLFFLVFFFFLRLFCLLYFFLFFFFFVFFSFFFLFFVFCFCFFVFLFFFFKLRDGDLNLGPSLKRQNFQSFSETFFS